MSAVSSAGLAELHEVAASPLARPSAAQLLPAAQSAEGIPRLERRLHAAARRAPRELAGAAGDLLRAGVNASALSFSCSPRARPFPGSEPAAAFRSLSSPRWCIRRRCCTTT